MFEMKTKHWKPMASYVAPPSPQARPKSQLIRERIEDARAQLREGFEKRRREPGCGPRCGFDPGPLSALIRKLKLQLKAELTLEALRRQEEGQTSFMRNAGIAAGAYLDDIVDNCAGFVRKPGETDDSLRRRLFEFAGKLGPLFVLLCLLGCDPFGAIPEHAPPADPTIVASVAGGPAITDASVSFPAVLERKDAWGSIPPPPPSTLPPPPDDPTSPCIPGYEQVHYPPEADVYCWPLEGYPIALDSNGCRNRKVINWGPDGLVQCER